MSYSLFDKGYTAEQIKGMYKPTQDELMMEKLRKWKESEHILNMLRSIRASNDRIEDMQAALWLKATKRRH